MNAIRVTALLPAVAALLLAPIDSGCSGPGAAIPFEATRAGAIMTALRDRHGGVERFQRYAGVVFSYRVEFRDQVRDFHQIGLRFGDSRRLWIRSSPEADLLLLALRRQVDPLRARPVTAVATASGGPDQRVALAAARAPAPQSGPITGLEFREPELDLALRTIPFLFEPSLTTSRGPWQYRTLLAPGRAVDGRRLEVEPWPSFPVDGNYLLESDPRTGLLKQILYRGTHPVIRGRTQLVTFEDYATIQNIKVARRRIHRRPVDENERELRRNPFLLPAREREEVFLSDRLDGVRFLTTAEADELLPLPSEEEDTGSGAPREESAPASPTPELGKPKPLPLAFPIELAPGSATMAIDE